MISQSDIEGLLKLKSDGSLYHRESQTLEFKETAIDYIIKIYQNEH